MKEQHREAVQSALADVDRLRRAGASEGWGSRLAWFVDWDDVRHFLALPRTGSVRAAGSLLGVGKDVLDRLGTRVGDRTWAVAP